MFFCRRSPSHDLTRNDYVLSAICGRRKALRWGAGLLLAIGVVWGGAKYFESHPLPALFLSDPQVENRQLRDALDKARLDLGVEVATRTELERQVASLTEQLRQANEELAFLNKSASRRPGGS